MRYIVDSNADWWAVKDTQDDMAAVMFLSRKRCPDAEFMARTQCDFLNQSPAMKAA